MRNVKRRPSGLIFSSLFLVVVQLALWQRQAIYDWTRLRGYQPPADIQQLAQATTMNNQASHIFYVQHPSLESKDTFNDHCQATEQTIVLGCYVSRSGIYIYAVDDERLNGIKQVTSAHEMLHAAYDRLGSKDKKQVNKWLNETYASLDDPRIKETVESYRKAGADVTNELHSILGTEVRGLSPELENYYKRYFNNRAQVVGFSEAYEQVFTQRKNQVNAYDDQLKDLKTRVNSDQAELDNLLSDLQARRKKLDQDLANKQYAAYNAGVPVYNSKVETYNDLVNATRSLIDQYNAILKNRNAIALEEQELYKAIDSRPATAENAN